MWLDHPRPLIDAKALDRRKWGGEKCPYDGTLSRVSGVVVMADFPIYLIQEGLTEDDLDQLGDSLANTGIRFELDNGRLILMSPVKAWHMDVSRRLCNVLVARGKHAYQEQGIRINKGKVRYPDVGVFWQEPDLDRSRHDPADFALVIEVVSPDSVEEDRVVKPRVYSAAGIPQYWIVDRHPTGRRDAIIEYFKLGVSGTYERTGEAALSDLEKTG
jgi:Uma2 family endonuclease